MIKIIGYILRYSIVFFIIFLGAGPVYAKKPPWAGEDWNPSNPPSAPEPLSLTLIGMGASGVAGYVIGKRKKDKK